MKRIQRKRIKGWRMPENAIYVGRGTQWGNPYRIIKNPHQKGMWIIEGWGCGVVAEYCSRAKYCRKETALACAISMYEKDIREKYNTPSKMRGYLMPLVAYGGDLACWCSLDTPCHADVLLSLAREYLPAWFKDETI